jgi:hypothetical protein
LNQEGTNNSQDIDLGYESTEEIAALIQRHSYEYNSERPTDSKVSKSLSYIKTRGDKEPKRTRRSIIIFVLVSLHCALVGVDSAHGPNTDL